MTIQLFDSLNFEFIFNVSGRIIDFALSFIITAQLSRTA